ncbi:hypothetical protein Fcan01_14176 [Folsomia candida]|uniref:Uncharacterized protein n=1 Tax=Folsomia candida TaxID=158441 RepID=A0A226DZE8_FOLCA|nr:hypothetical protein Fcan01_14176 [Folsomia candida]
MITSVYLFLLPLFAISTASSPFHDDLPTLKGKVVTGIYSEESPLQTLLYEKVVPLVFEFRLRSDLWSNLPVGFNKFKILPRLNCRSDNKSATTSTTDWLFTCPVFFHVHEFLKQYKANYTDIHPAFRAGLRQATTGQQLPQDYQKFSHHASLHFEDCEQIIARSWKGIYGRDMGLAEYRVLLEKCNTLPSYFEEQITDYTSDPGTLFDAMKDNFMAPDPDSGEMINNLLALQGLHLINTFSEITRLREALLSCQNHVLPYSFLKVGRLDKALQELRLKLIPQKYTLPTGLTISKLLKLPVADCIFGPTTMVVQLLLPVLRVERSYSLMRFTYPTFLYEDQLCGVKSVSDLPRHAQPEYFHFDRASRTLMEASRPAGDLCHMPDSSQRPLVNRCIFELLNASFEAIRVREFCSLHCDPLPPEYGRKTLPLIQRVSPTRFVIAVNRITSILIKCEGKPDEMITPQIYGSVEVTLPCNCYLTYHDDKFYARAPCGNSLFVQHVIPDHMVNSSWNQEGKYFLAEPTTKVNFSLFSPEDTVSLVDLESISSSAERGESLTLSSPKVEGDDGSGGNNTDDACYSGHIMSMEGVR